MRIALSYARCHSSGTAGAIRAGVPCGTLVPLRLGARTGLLCASIGRVVEGRSQRLHRDRRRLRIRWLLQRGKHVEISPRSLAFFGLVTLQEPAKLIVVPAIED